MPVQPLGPEMLEQLLAPMALSSRELITTDQVLLPHDKKKFPSIGLAAARGIDRSISWQEAVSLTFLIVEPHRPAIQVASSMESRGANLFSNSGGAQIGIVEMLVLSAEKNKAVSWEMKVYQALRLVGQKRLLYDLGVEDGDIEEELAGGRYVKSTRRLLFFLCEYLSSKQAARLASLLQPSTPHTGSLELFLLGLMLARGSEDLCGQLLAALKEMESADLVSHFLALGEGDSCSCSLHKAASTAVSRPLALATEEDYYKQGAGLAVIVNQKIFPPGLQDRLGTDRDRDELKATFTLYEGDVVVWDNLAAQDMMVNLELASHRANNPAYNYNWVAVCILSHGRRVDNVDQVLGSDGQGVDRKHIVDMFANATKCPNLHKKPKFFIFQACRGTEAPEPTTPSTPEVPDKVATDSGAVPTVRGWPGMSDYVIASSTIEDFVAFRSTVDGSFYIRHLCKELQDRGHQEHLADILIMVNNKVMGYRPDYPSAPEFTTTMSKKFQLRRTRESTEKCVAMMARNKLFNLLLGDFIESKTCHG